ncbi:MAG: MFS transporter [Bradyrhizobium sp.]
MKTRPADGSREASRAPISILVLLAGTFMAVLDFFIVNVAIPGMQHDLRASDAEIQFVVAGYAVAYASALIIGSRLGDRFGRRRIFLLGVRLFAVSSAICGFTPNAAAPYHSSIPTCSMSHFSAWGSPPSSSSI